MTTVKKPLTEPITSDVRQLLDRDPFDASAVADLREALNRDPSRYKTLREAIHNIQERSKGHPNADAHLRIGVAEVLQGRYGAGLDHLAKSGSAGVGHFFRGIALFELGRFGEAAEAYAAASKAGYEPRVAELRRAGALRRGGNDDAARETLKKLDNLAGSSAEYHYQRGSLLAAEGELADAAAELTKATQLDRDHTGALFELAYINDLYGNDEAAVDLYKQCLRRPPVPIHAYINLGVLYEDEMRFRDAENCYRQVLAVEPNHPRARLFFKDCRASRDMYYDEEAERGYDRLRQLLEIPVTDFELSVRSRNCLRKMNIRTLGDLTRTNEATLLASKNFGETSLAEIKEMLASKGLRLGMALEGGDRAADFRADPVEELSQEEKALLGRPISELNLSVRARKCMSKLNINTIGDLISRTGDDLLECKNFGVTSLNEVRDKLTEMNLKLKND
ncbi:MAG TPA: DNA-directed RNA polymerase subunit alpha C-terminal domain-containing protein [Isosphaeraceae bacterium]|jgi:DNA-directed RNA polymerase subunit alpha|nr:DNA-directed RNA polymerase subunit alpha C-terminal domain-containing protein [Isosphaeraceae bacterium]